VNRGVGVMVGVGVGVMVSVAVMATGVVTAAPGGRGVVVHDAVAEGVSVGPGDGVMDGVVVEPIVALGVGVSVPGTALDLAATGTDGNAGKVGMGVTVGLATVGVAPVTMVGAGWLPHPARVFKSMMESMSTIIHGVLVLLLRCRPRGRSSFRVFMVIFRCKSCQRWLQ
jgi:hypothetical protein